MIYPFTRMVIYGAIWYQGIQLNFHFFHREIIHLIGVGEANAHGNGTDTYACAFYKMISNWRKIWSANTIGATSIHFPFGFVQVYSSINSLKNCFVFRSYRQLRIQLE